MFIELTSYTGKKMIVNTDHIESVTRYEAKGSFDRDCHISVLFHGEAEICIFQETYEYVRDLLIQKKEEV